MPVSIANQAEPIPGYRLIERLGRGGFGEVWKAEAPGGLFKAIKFVFGDLEGAGDQAKQAEQELKSLNRIKTIRHPYILSLERVDQIEGQLIIVMELADHNLWDRFRECRTQGLPGIPRDEMLRYMEETAEALDLMNVQYQLQHLDIKPQNLFLVHNHIKVADFGLVKDFEGARATVTGGVTPVYAAPETFDGWASRTCDQYSLAIVYQELVTGRRPFNGTGARQLLMQHLQSPPDLSNVAPHEQAALGRALSKKPDDRFPTCMELVQALRASRPSTPGPGTLSTTPPAAGPVGTDFTGAVGQMHTPGAEALSSPTVDDRPARPPGRSIDYAPPPLTLAPPSLPPLTQPRAALFQTSSLSALNLRPAPSEKTGTGELLPALVVGAGRLGQAVLRQLRRVTCERYGVAVLPHLRLLYLETDADAVQEALADPDAPDALQPGEVVLARLNRPAHYLKPRDGLPAIDRWLPTQMVHRLPRNPVTGGVRAFGRLALCDNYRSVSQRLRAELEAVTDPAALAEAGRLTKQQLRTNRPRVYVVAGLGGGTGGGTFLDLGYLLKTQLRHLGYARPEVVGVFLLPAVDRNTPGTLAVGNAYAALAELAHFSSPHTTYETRFDLKEPPVVDAERPFQRCVLLALPKSGDPTRTPPAARLAGSLLYRELLTPLGRTADERRQEYFQAFPPNGAVCQTFGLYRLAWPRSALLRQAGRQLGRQLLQSWTAKDNAAQRPSVAAWFDEQWERWNLTPETLVERLAQAARSALGQPPADWFDAAVNALAAQAGPAAHLDPAAADAVLKKLVRSMDRFEDDGPDPTAGTLADVLDQAARAAAAEAEGRFAETVRAFIDRPQYRLTAAEEVLRQVEAKLHELLGPLEQAVHVQEMEAFATLALVPPQIKALRETSRAGKKLAIGAELLEVLRKYPRQRYQSLLTKATRTIYRGLLGALPECQRMAKVARVRLGELHEAVEADVGGRSEDMAGPGRFLFPHGCRTLEEAAHQFLAGLTAADTLAFEQQLQAQIARQVRSLAAFCLDTADSPAALKTILEDEAEAFVATRLGECNPAEVFFQHHPQAQAAHRDLLQAYDEAAPELVGPRPRPEAQVCVLAVPADAAGQKFRDLAAAALPDVELVPAANAEDLVFYRENRHVQLADLPQLGPFAQDAFRQIGQAEQGTLFSRTDVSWQSVER